MYGSEDKKEKTLVFVSNIPAAFKGVKMLKALVKRNTPGGLLDCRIIDGSGYALLMFDCEPTAIAACRSRIHWDVKVDTPELEAEAETISQQLKSKNMNYNDLVKLKQEIGREVMTNPAGKSSIRYHFVLRVVQQEHKVVVEETYKPSLLIQGTDVEKSQLAMSLGLMDAYRGEKAPKWCLHTQNQRDCRLGASCNFIHLKAYQTTTKRSREFTADGALLSGDAIGGGAADTNGPKPIHDMWEERVAPLFGGCGTGVDTTNPSAPTLVPVLGRIPLTVEDLGALLDGGSSPLHQVLKTVATSSSSAATTLSVESVADMIDSPSMAIIKGLARKMVAAMGDSGSTDMVPFLRLDTPFDGSTVLPFFACPSGLTSFPPVGGSAGLRDMQGVGRCIMPTNGAPTPMERDGFIREVLLKRALVSAITNAHLTPSSPEKAAFGALCIFLASPGVMANLQAHLETARGGTTPISLPSILIHPHYILGHIVQECRYFVKNSKVVCVAQKADSVLVEGGWLEQVGGGSSSSNNSGGMSRMLSSTHRDTELAELISERVSAVAKGIEGWLQGTQSRDVTCCVHVVFPRGIYGTSPALPLDSNSLALPPNSCDGQGTPMTKFGQPVFRVPTVSSKLVRPTPSSLHINALIHDESPLISPPSDLIAALSRPVILGLDSFDAAVAISSLYSLSGGARTEATIPIPGVAGPAVTTLWRKNRTSNQPMFSREHVLDKLQKQQE